MPFVLNAAIEPSGLPTGAPGTAIADWVDLSNSLYIGGGGVLSIPVTAGGAGLTTLAISVGAPTDGSWNPKKVTATAVANIVDGVLASVLMTGLGIGYSTAPAPTAPGVTLGAPTIMGKVLACVAGNAPYSQFGAQGGLLRPSASTSLNQRMVAEFYTPSSAYTAPPLVLRADENTKKRYVVYWKNGIVRIYAFDNYLGGTTSGVTKLLEVTVDDFVVGHKYRLTATAQGSSPTTLTVLCEDVTAGTTVYSGSKTSSFEGLQTAGQMGVGVEANKVCATLLAAYNETYFTLDPDELALNQTGVAVAVSGINTSFQSDGETFKLEGGSGAQIVSQSVVNNAVATLVVDSGSEAGQLVISGNVSGIESVLTVSALSAPDAVLDSVQAGGATVSAEERPAFGNTPYLVELWRGTKADFDAAAGEGTKVDTQALGEGDDVLPVTDTGASSGMAYYRWVARDAEGQVAQGLSVGTNIPIGVERKVIGWGGDSIRVGVAGGTVFTRELVNVKITNPGANYTEAQIVIDGAGEATPVIIGGQVAYAVLTDRAYGQYTDSTAPPSVVITGDGTGALASSQVGGGMVEACMDALASIHAFSDLESQNCAQGGTVTGEWIPSAAPTYYLERLKAHLDPATVRAVVIGLGTNDAAQSVTKAALKANLILTIDDLLAWGAPVVVLIKPPSRAVLSDSLATANSLILQYHDAMDELEDLYPGEVYAIRGRDFAYFLAHPEQLPDGVHPNDRGYAAMGAGTAVELAPILRSLLVSEAAQSTVVEVAGTLTIRRGFDHVEETDTELSLVVSADLSSAQDVYLQDPRAYTDDQKQLLPATVELLGFGSARLVWQPSSAVTSQLVKREAHSWPIVADGSVVATVNVEVV
jgi:lysophospholipase L1-like esterase